MKLKTKKIIEFEADIEVNAGSILRNIHDGSSRAIITDGFGKFTTMDAKTFTLITVVGWYDSIEDLLRSGWYRTGWAINGVEFSF